jgi:hypothetical protein
MLFHLIDRIGERISAHVAPLLSKKTWGQPSFIKKTEEEY